MKAALLLFASLGVVMVSAKDESPPEPVEDKIIVLEPFKVRAAPINSFGINFRIYMDPATKKVERIFITRVIPNTDAERLGLQVGDEIVKIDGVLVQELDARLNPDTVLGKTFLKREAGAPLDLEVITRRAKKFTLRAQRGVPLMD